MVPDFFNGLLGYRRLGLDLFLFLRVSPFLVLASFFILSSWAKRCIRELT